MGGSDETIDLAWVSASDDTGSYEGVRISGLTKCASAQWEIQGEDAVGDQYAASYACAVGDDTTHEGGIHYAKQIWAFIPCGSASSSSSDDDVSVNAKVDAVVSSSSSSSSGDCKYNQQESFIHMNSTGVYDACADKIALFEKRHPELAPFYTPTSKRSLHKRRAEQMTQKMAKRTTTQYCIIPYDHLVDMTATIIEASETYTYGGYTGLTLGHYTGADSVTEAMLWTVESA